MLLPGKDYERNVWQKILAVFLTFGSNRRICLIAKLPNCTWEAPCTAIPKPEDTRRNPGGQIAVGWEMLDGKISLEAVENVLLNRDDGGNIL